MRKIVLLITLVFFLSLNLAGCGSKVNVKEAKDSCIKEAENFVSGYLSNSDASFLEKYEKDPEKALNNYRLKFSYSSKKDENAEVSDRIADYVLKHASFEVDTNSFNYNKDTEIASLYVTVTIIPPVIVRDQIENILSQGAIGGNDLYDQAIAIVNGIDPITSNIIVQFVNSDGEWLIKNYISVMKQINDIGQVTENMTSSTMPSSKNEIGDIGSKGDKDTSKGGVASKVPNATSK